MRGCLPLEVAALLTRLHARAPAPDFGLRSQFVKREGLFACVGRLWCGGGGAILDQYPPVDVAFEPLQMASQEVQLTPRR